MNILDRCEELDRADRELVAGDAGPDDLRTAARWIEEYYGSKFNVQRSTFNGGNAEPMPRAEDRPDQGDVRWPDGFFPTTGVAVRRGGSPIVVIPVYLEATSRVAVAGHFTAAPGLPPRLLRLAALAAVRGCQDFARRNGRPFLIAIWGRRSISRIAARCGFRNADTVQEQIFIHQEVTHG